MWNSFVGVLADTVQKDIVTHPHHPFFLKGNNNICDSTNSKENKTKLSAKS